MDNPTYPAVDDKGYSYASQQELCDAIDFLDEDADYLERQVCKYRDKAVKDRIRSNAQHSRQWAVELKRMLADRQQAPDAAGE